MKSPELRKSYETERGEKRVEEVGKEEERVLERSWKDVPDITGVRVNKRLNNNNQQLPTFNPLTCTSLSLNSPTK